jgi:hypothetical protein
MFEKTFFLFLISIFLKRSNLIKDTLPSLVNQYMQTCQQQLVQPRLSSFVSDHIEHVYNSIGKYFSDKYVYFDYLFKVELMFIVHQHPTLNQFQLHMNLPIQKKRKNQFRLIKNLKLQIRLRRKSSHHHRHHHHHQFHRKRNQYQFQQIRLKKKKNLVFYHHYIHQMN